MRVHTNAVGIYKAVLAGILFTGMITGAVGQTISPWLVGNNVWLNPDTRMWNLGAECKLQSIRIGGEAYDRSVPSQTSDWITRIRGMGAQPIMQVPSTYTATQAADLVRRYPQVIYWNIGNEPGLGGQGVATVSALIKRCAPAMKAVNPDIKIFVADECDLWYGGRYYEQLFSVTGGQYDVSGRDQNGRWMVDGISWHRYASGDITNDVSQRIREARELADRVSTAKGRTGSARLQVGIGEFNHNGGAGVHTFTNGQAFGCIYGACMRYEYTYACTWSMFENGGSRTGTDFSYIDGPTGAPRATYYHMQMIAGNFSGTYAHGQTNRTDVVAYGCKDIGKNKLCAIIMNKGTGSLPLSLRFDNGAITTGTLRINLNAGISGIYQDNIPARSTMCLVFTNAGSRKILYRETDFNSVRAPATTTITSPFSFSDNPETALPVPGKIEAEKYSAMSGIQTQATTDAGGGLNVGWIENGDWMDYAVNVAAGGSYKVNFRVASANAGGRIELRRGTTVLGSVNVNGTGGWQNWVTVSATVPLSAGQQTLRLAFSGTGALMNVNWFEFTSALPPQQRIEAESYSAMYGIQTQSTTDAGGGLNAGWIDNGDWMDYGINVAAAGSYRISFRVASATAGGRIELRRGTSVLGSVNVTGTGGWQNWTTVSTTVSLSAGQQTVRLSFSGSGALMNLNWFELTAVSLAKQAVNFRNLVSVPAISSLALNIAHGADQFMVSLPHSGTFSLDVYDISGRQMFSYRRADAQAGLHTVVWNQNNKRISGITAIVKLSFGKETITRKTAL